MDPPVNEGSWQMEVLKARTLGPATRRRMVALIDTASEAFTTDSVSYKANREEMFFKHLERFLREIEEGK
jgi:hypothetical protein